MFVTRVTSVTSISVLADGAFELISEMLLNIGHVYRLDCSGYIRRYMLPRFLMEKVSARSLFPSVTLYANSTSSCECLE